MSTTQHVQAAKDAAGAKNDLIPPAATLAAGERRILLEIKELAAAQESKLKQANLRRAVDAFVCLVKVFRLLEDLAYRSRLRRNRSLRIDRHP